MRLATPTFQGKKLQSRCCRRSGVLTDPVRKSAENLPPLATRFSRIHLHPAAIALHAFLRGVLPPLSGTE